jgi:hypothetical protein
MWLIALFSTSAQAFCGYYVGSAGTELYNHASEVAIVREGLTTTLTMRNDVSGDPGNFAMVIPVPEKLEDDDIHVVENGVFDVLDAYSAPRLVRYECYESDSDTDADSDADADSDWDQDTGDVAVEARYTVGEYEAVLLSAEESSSLFAWLNSHGYAVPDSSVPVLQDYIDAGQMFLAAKVSADLVDLETSDVVLSPLQIRYDSSTFSVPIRLGTLNSTGVQDLTIYALGSAATGAVGISNYAAFAVPDECMWASQDGESFGEYYLRKYDEAWQALGTGIGWNTEYSWSNSSCDPCSGNPPAEQDLMTLGYEGDTWNVHFTRLHLRYTPEAATQDVSLYFSNMAPQEQVRFIEYEACLTDQGYEVCSGLDLMADPSDLPDDVKDVLNPGNPERSNTGLTGLCGCQARGMSPTGVLIAMAWVLFGRRR